MAKPLLVMHANARFTMTPSQLMVVSAGNCTAGGDDSKSARHDCALLRRNAVRKSVNPLWRGIKTAISVKPVSYLLVTETTRTQSKSALSGFNIRGIDVEIVQKNESAGNTLLQVVSVGHLALD